MRQRRTDLALEAKELWEESARQTAKLEGVTAFTETREGFLTETVEILDERGEKALGKPAGRYVTLTMDGLLRREEDAFPRAARAVAGELADVVVVTSDNPRTEQPQAIIADILPGLEGQSAQVHVEPDRREAIAWALSQAGPGDVIVLAGKGHETYQEIQGIQYHLDEREVVAAWFAGREAESRAGLGKGQNETGKVPADVV